VEAEVPRPQPSPPVVALKKQIPIAAPIAPQKPVPSANSKQSLVEVDKKKAKVDQKLGKDSI
jgi:hypothetical protein